MAWGKGPSTSKDDFVALCAKISTNKTSSNSLTLLHSKYASIWNPETILLLCNSLAKNTSLEELHCTGFDFGVDGCLALGVALKANTTLKRLTFGHHATFTDEQLEAFLSCPPKFLLELDLERKNLTSKSGKVLGNALAQNHQIKVLNVSGNALGNGGFSDLLTVDGIYTQPIQSLLASAIAITALPVGFASMFANLVVLNLSDNVVGADGMLELAKLKCDELILNNCEVGDVGCMTLARGEPRKRLSLVRNSITPLGVLVLAENLLRPHARTLQYLNLSHNTALGDSGLDKIAQNLTTHISPLILDVGYCNGTKIPHAFLTHLDGLNFGGNGPMLVDELITGVIETRLTCRVSTLGITGTGLTDIARLFQALHVSTALSVLECGGIPMTAEDRQALEHLNQANPDLDVAVDRGEEGGPPPTQ
ncbi:hypothetical protein BASA81_006579 [Batrachochytrium salamandrivorans]|nr:hypothetical protein BASA81_006579 [Batrachochytrium salamandrivorans]